MAADPITARQVISLLEIKHGKDVCFAEVKNGPTWFSNHRRLDFWAMRRSWSKPLITGYEVKVIRTDFLNDDKWPEYLPFCNQFYFVCPPGMIAPEELGGGCGLIYTSKNAGRLFTKRKAPHREIDPAVMDSLFRYLLMSRTDPSPRDWMDEGSNVAFWRAWLRKKKENRELGYRVATVIREHVQEVESENRKLKSANEAFDQVKARLEEMGLNPEQAVHQWGLANKVEELLTGVPDDLLRTLRQAHERTGEAVEKLERSRVAKAG